MKIISLSGKIGSGKDTAFNLLSEYLNEQGHKCVNLSFANKLKDNVAHMFHWDRLRLQDDFDYKEGDTLDDGSPDPACELLGMTRRKVMQVYGSEAVRMGLHPDTWVITLKLDILHGLYNEYDYGFISDARFENELQFVKDLHGTTIKIHKSGGVSALPDDASHISELDWEKWTDWDATVENTIDANLTTEQNLLVFKNALIKSIPMF